MQETRHERTHFRDEKISLIHREWGCCGAVDLDFILNEYRAGRSCALIEYKHENSLLARKIFSGDKKSAFKILQDGTYRALKDLGDKAKEPVFVCIYSDDLTKYHVFWLNDYASQYIPKMQIFNEVDYVNFLYELRGLEMQNDLRIKLENRSVLLL